MIANFSLSFLAFSLSWPSTLLTPSFTTPMKLIIPLSPLKLASSNYISWKLQFHTPFIGYDLLGYIDGSKPCPPANLPHNNTTIPNLEHILWIRQDQLTLNAIIGSLSPTIIPFIAQSKASREAWTILTNTYAKPSLGRIKHTLKLN